MKNRAAQSVGSVAANALFKLPRRTAAGPKASALATTIYDVERAIQL